MSCHLCRLPVPVVGSHIIPEFLYAALYDEAHRFRQISLSASQRDQIKQKGLREPLLCEICEQGLSVYEDYMRRLLRGGVSVSVTPDGQHLRLTELDYDKLKLFQLSVLWRSGVSKLQTFSQVQLGPHAEKIRQMLLAKDPGKAGEYGCIMSVLQNDGELLEGLHVSPTYARLGRQKAYRFVFGGLVFVYLVSSMPPPGFLLQALAQPDGTALVRRQEIKEMDYLMSTFKRLKEQGKLGHS